MIYGKITGFNEETNRPIVRLEDGYGIELETSEHNLKENPEIGAQICVTDIEIDDDHYTVAYGWWMIDPEQMQTIFEAARVTWWHRLKDRIWF